MLLIDKQMELRLWVLLQNSYFSFLGTLSQLAKKLWKMTIDIVKSVLRHLSERLPSGR